jgi:hypothetical protein
VYVLSQYFLSLASLCMYGPEYLISIVDFVSPNLLHHFSDFVCPSHVLYAIPCRPAEVRPEATQRRGGPRERGGAKGQGRQS